MTDESGRGGWGVALLGACLGVSLIVSAVIVSKTLLTVKRQGQAIEVKGYAEKQIVSDLATWEARVTARGPALETAYERLEADRAKVQGFLDAQPFAKGRYELSPVSTEVLYLRDREGNRTNQIEGYRLSQTVRLTSEEIQEVTRVSREASGLIRDGVEIDSSRPEYFYTKLETLKLEMLGAATADARRRAEVLAGESGSEVGVLRGAQQGVFQITPAHSTEVSSYGRNDTSSVEKSIKAVVTIRYAIE